MAYTAEQLQRVRRILIIKWSALGDVVIATAVMQDLRQAFPDALIDLNTLPSAARFFTHDRRFSEVFAIDVRQRGRKMQRGIEWLRRVRRGRYDLIVDLQRSDRSRMLLALLMLSGHRVRMRWGNRGGFPYTLHPPRAQGPQPAIEQHRAILQAAGLETPTVRPVLHAPPEHMAQAQEVLVRHGLHRDAFAVFLPGSQAAGWLKRWGASRYAALGGVLLDQGLAKIAVVGGPEEVDECRQLCDILERTHPGRAVHLDSLPLLQIGPVCETARVIVANDTGLAHLAAAADRPMYVICGPTDPRRVKPLGEKVVALQAKLECASCYGKECRIAASVPCMEAITPTWLAGVIVGRRDEDARIQFF